MKDDAAHSADGRGVGTVQGPETIISALKSANSLRKVVPENV